MKTIVEEDGSTTLMSDGFEQETKQASEWYRNRAAEHPYKHQVVDHPEHYTAGAIECIDAIQAALTKDEFRGYCKGQAIAYLWRERLKGGDTDISKAEWYCKRLVK